MLAPLARADDAGPPAEAALEAGGPDAGPSAPQTTVTEVTVCALPQVMVEQTETEAPRIATVSPPAQETWTPIAWPAPHMVDTLLARAVAV